MRFGTVKKGEDIRNVKFKEINQSQLTSDCWMIQMQGIEACENCEFLNTEDCGGQEILKKIKHQR